MGNKQFTESHEWVEPAGEGTVRIGITGYGIAQLGEVVHVELPKVGQEIMGAEEAAVLESTKAAADFYAPLGGKVSAVNEALMNDITPLNKDPEGEGWLFILDITGRESKKEKVPLMDRAAYERMTEG